MYGERIVTIRPEYRNEDLFWQWADDWYGRYSASGNHTSFPSIFGGITLLQEYNALCAEMDRLREEKLMDEGYSGARLWDYLKTRARKRT